METDQTSSGEIPLSTEPTVFVQGNEKYNVLKEGQARILYSQGNEVFYNPAQEVNRDLSIMVIKMFAEELKKEREAALLKKEEDKEKNAKRKKNKKEDEQIFESSLRKPEDGIKILEALSATGLRSIRYIKEIPGIKSIIANDIDANAVAAILRNIEYNGVDPKVVIPNHADATTCMYNHRDIEKRFDVVDLDPYGGASIFLDGAVQSIAEGGLMCVTCTDMAVLCGNHSEACFAKYGSMPLHSRFHHEMGLRIVLACIESHANRYKRYVVPVLTMHIDFYVRIFVRVYTSPNEVKKSPTKLSNVYQCVACDSFSLQPLCKMHETENGGYKFTPSLVTLESNKCGDCGRAIRLGGPMWSNPIHNKDWVSRLLAHIEDKPELYNQSKKIHGLLTAVNEELPDQPLYYTLESITNTLHVTNPPMIKIKSALMHQGYKVSGSHTNPNAIKTNAPSSAVWDVMRGWAKLNPVSKKRTEAVTSPGSVILSKEPNFVANFEKHPDLVNQVRIPRFIPNQPEWGPGTRAGKKKSAKKQTYPPKKPYKRREQNGENNNNNNTDSNTLPAESASNEKPEVEGIQEAPSHPKKMKTNE